ncbi:hypothetical protein BAUCODRAFT_361042 [Baudoinia panamericana UAMH 10762]|uniref:Uncharacterized protein n=1 Tax=Baudoinia panamericana (strain UAMH 10762) TaxID=717646 RepID=M2MT33_BAUPA|nr:uncharacterized protein BAUCODRAFT_361042 [Baudoinia panamericana UAMH 10762]EMD00022.1 hypothetical protein BAUCODRAFT_361042 [Baudoinia panamericana UAMH 10762]
MDQVNGRPKIKDERKLSKRPRLSGEASATIGTKCADGTTAVEVDIMILDYLAYQAITACLAERQRGDRENARVSPAHNLAMTEAFFQLFEAQHKPVNLDAELRFRLLLLQLTTLFTQRLIRNPSTPSRPSLNELRQSNGIRARTWIGSPERIPSVSNDTNVYDDPAAFSKFDELERNRAHVLHSLGIAAEDEHYEDAFYGTADCVALLDLLPLFMQVSAARLAMMAVSVTEVWMQIAAAFMLQACLEQYLVIGAQGTDAIDEAYAWGFRDLDSSAPSESKATEGDAEAWIDEVNDMFTDPVYEIEVKPWAAIKQVHLGQLFPPRGPEVEVPSTDRNEIDASMGEHRAPNLTSHLESVAAQHPIAAFEESMLNYLEALSQSVPQPVLAQLDNGRLDGMSARETREFIRDCGVSTARFFESPFGFKALSSQHGHSKEQEKAQKARRSDTSD